MTTTNNNIVDEVLQLLGRAAVMVAGLRLDQPLRLPDKHPLGPGTSKDLREAFDRAEREPPPGETFDDLLDAAGLTMGELANQIGSSPVTVARIRKGRHKPWPRTLHAIASALHVAPSRLRRAIQAQIALEVP